MTGAAAAGLIAGYGVALPVGPIATYLVSLGARRQLRTAIAAALGVATTDGVFAAVAAFGGRGLQSSLRPIAEPLTYLSAVVLIALALRTLASVVKRHRANSAAAVAQPNPSGPLRAYVALVALTALNPSTIAYFSALVLGDRSRTVNTTASAALFTAGVFFASASWQLSLAASGHLLGRLLTGARARLFIAGTSAAIMLVLAARLLAA